MGDTSDLDPITEVNLTTDLMLTRDVELTSDDHAVPSGLALRFGAPVQAEGTWLPYRLAIASGNRQAALEDVPDAVGRCWLGLSPKDELACLLARLDDLLEGRRTRMQFEPDEPNFSLEIAAAPEGWTVVCWLDAGNQLSDHFTWDSLGVRFFTQTPALRTFRESLALARTAALAPQVGFGSN